MPVVALAPFLLSLFKKKFFCDATFSKFCSFSSATFVRAIAVAVFNVASHLFLDARCFNRSAFFFAFEIERVVIDGEGEGVDVCDDVLFAFFRFSSSMVM